MLVLKLKLLIELNSKLSREDIEELLKITTILDELMKLIDNLDLFEEILNKLPVIEQLLAIVDGLGDQIEEMLRRIEEAQDDWRRFEDEILPEIEKLKGTFASVQPFVINVTETVYASTDVVIPYYNYTFSDIVVHLNGVLTLEFEKIPSANPDDKYANVLRFFNDIESGTQITGLIFVSPDSNLVPEVVLHDATLEGTGMADDLLRIESSLLTELHDDTARLVVVEDILAEEKTFVSDAVITTTASSGDLVVDSKSTKGNTSQVIHPIPMASELISGLLTSGMYSQIMNNAAAIDSLQGANRVVYDEGNVLTIDSTQTDIQNVWNASGFDLVDGVIIENWDISVRWRWRSGTWYGPYDFSVSQKAGIGVLGIVQGVEATPANVGKVYVEADGSMSLLGYDDIKMGKLWTAGITIPVPYTANTNIGPFPDYPMGFGSLAVYVTGVRTDQFIEVDKNTIQLTADITDSTLTVARVIVDCFKV